MATLGCDSDMVEFEGRDAWRLENNRLRVTVLEGGGHLAEIVLKDASGGESINPLWVPGWPSIEPWEFDPEKDARYGKNSEGATLASIMGHNLCFDFWGAPSPSEYASGLAFHGDVSVLRSTRLAQDSHSLTHHFDLKRSGTALTRTLRLPPDQPVLYFEEVAENKLGIDRPFGWVQHVTFGAPFVDPEAVFFDASATYGHVTDAKEQESAVEWPVGSQEEPHLDHRRFAPQAPSFKMSYFLLDPQREVAFISAVNTDHRLLIAYLFHRRDFPWLMVWEENRNRQHTPWNGREMTRGMEFGNTRIPGTFKAYFEQPIIYETPTFGWLNAYEKRTAKYLAILSRVPEEWVGVQDIRLEDNRIIIEGKGQQESLAIPFQSDLFERW